MLDPLTSDVGEEAGGEVLDLLANNEAKGGEHGNAAMDDLRFAPPLELLDCRMKKRLVSTQVRVDSTRFGGTRFGGCHVQCRQGVQKSLLALFGCANAN